MNLRLSIFRKKALPKAMFAWLTLFVSLAVWLGSVQDAAAQAPWKGSELFVYHMVGKPPFNNRYPACMKFVNFTSPTLVCPPPPPTSTPSEPSGGGQSDQGGGLAFMDEDFMSPPPGGVFDAFQRDIIGLSFYLTNKACHWSTGNARLTVCPVKGSNTVINGFYFEYGVSMTGGGAAGMAFPTLTVLVSGVEVYKKTFTSSDRYNGFYAAFPETLNTTSWEGKNVTFEVSDVRERIIDDFAIIGTNNCSGKVCLGNLVWGDTNNDGIKDAAEPVKPGVKVQVFRDDKDGILEMPTIDYLFEDGKDGLIAETTTDANGNYNVCLPEGSYFVRIPPTNFDSGQPLYQCFPTLGASVDGNSDEDNKDHTNPSSKSTYKTEGMVSTLVTLTVGGEPTNDGNDANTNSTIDFGVVCDPSMLMNLGNLVWEDTNKDGLKGSNEPGINDVNLELYLDVNANGSFDAADVLADKTTTSGGGLYNFTGLLPGNYIVVVPENNYHPLSGYLVGYIPSPGKDPATDPDDNLDNDDNGIASGNYKIITQPVTLAFVTEPTDDGDGANGNLTVDIAVYKDPAGACSEYGINYVNPNTDAESMKFYDADGNFQRSMSLQPERWTGEIWYNEITSTIYYTESTTGANATISAKGPTINRTYNKTGSTSINYFDMMESPERDNYGNWYARFENGLFRVYPDQLPAFTVQTSAFTGAMTGADLADDATSYPARYLNKVFDRYNNIYMKAAGTGIVRFAYDPTTFKWIGGAGSAIEAGTNAPAALPKTLMYDARARKIYYFGTDQQIYSLPENFAAGTNATLESTGPVVISDHPSITQPTAILTAEFDARARRIVIIGTGVSQTYGFNFLNVNTFDVPLAGPITHRTHFRVPNTFKAQSSNERTSHLLVIPCGAGVSPPPGIELKLGNVIWNDVNNNGIKDAAEVGIANVGIILYRDSNGDGILNRLTDSRWDSTTTDASGYYLFDKLPEGDYFAWIPNSNFFTGKSLNGMLSSTPTIADPNTDIDNDDNGINPVMAQSHINDGVTSGKITMKNGTEPTTDGDDANGNMTLDFGFYTPRPNVDNVLRLGNRVWEDANNNIKIDVGEPYFNGVKLTLLKDNGDLMFDATQDVVVATTTTAGGGFYLFDKLLPGIYYVRVDKENFDAGQVLEKFVSSTGYYGANTCFDSTDHGNESAFYRFVDGVLTSYIALEIGQEPGIEIDGDDENGNMNMDFGFYRPVRLGNRVWKDTNKDGKRDASEPDLNGVMVNVYKDDGDGIFELSEDLYEGMRTTQDSGFYNFHDLIQGSYFVEIPSSNFVIGGGLENLVSSPGVVGENPAANNKDHGIDSATPVEGGTVSQIVNLAYGTEPLPAVDTDNDDSNFTIDFGFVEPTVNIDLALKKTLAAGQSSTVSTGGTAKFTISIINQGTVTATNVQVTDYIPTGLTLNDANWTAASGGKTALVTPIATLAPGETVTRDITFTVGTTTGVITNFAEISAATGGTDIDSTPDADPANDGTPKNDVINEDRKTTPANDEDDHDPEPITVVLACINPSFSAETMQASCENGVMQSDAKIRINGLTNSDKVGYSLGATYTGAAYASATAIPANGELLTGITNPAAATQYTIRVFNGSNTCYTDQTITLLPRTDCNDTQCVSPTFVASAIQATCSSSSALNNAKLVISGVSSGADKVGYSTGTSYTGSAYASATAIPATGIVASSLANPVAVTYYTIRVFNGSNTCYTDHVVSLQPKTCNAACPTEPVYTAVGTNPTCTGGTVNSNGTLSISGIANATKVGYSVGMPYSGPAYATATNVSGTSMNLLTGIANPTAPVTYTVRVFNGGSDCYIDQTVTLTPQECLVFDLALRKTLAAGQSATVNTGGTVKFTISVINQGTVDATNVQVTDYIPTGLTLNDANWTAVSGKATLNTPIATLAAGATMTRDITFTVGTTTGVITNFAEISAATGGTDIDSTPDADDTNDGTPKNDVINEDRKTTPANDEDDHDPEPITVTASPVFDLALKKTLAAGQSSTVSTGGTAKFTISIINQGTVAATNVQVTDYIPTGLTLNDANWTAASGGKTTLVTPIATMAVGETVTRDITFTVGTTTGVITNFAEISAATGGTDIDSTPDADGTNDGTPKNDVINEDRRTTPANDEDDHDPEPITVTAAPVFDLALKKTLAAGQSSTVNTGGTAKFTISITNQGTVVATNVQVTDYIPTGLTLNDANWTAASGGKTTLVTPIATMAVGETVTRDITFTVGTTTGVITNFAEISAATGGTDIDSTPDADGTNDGTPKNDVINEDRRTTPANDEDDHDPEPITVTTAPVCSVSLTATPSTCTAATNTYSVTGNLIFANAPSTGTLTVSMGTATQVFNAPFTSPQAYTLSGLTADGASHTVSAVFSAASSCTNTMPYTAPVSCLVVCTTPTFKSISYPATCSGTTANSDAKINLTNIANGDKTAYSQGSTYTGGAYSTATAVSGGAVMFSGITNLAGNNVYTVRVFNGSDACYKDVQVIIPVSDCNTLCLVDAGNDAMICNPVTTTDLKDAAATEEWIVGTGNPAVASINASTGIVSGMTADGIYSFILRDKVNTSCSDMVYVFRSMTTLPSLSSCETSYQLPTDGGVTWTVAAGNTASVTAAGLITGMTTNGTYTFNATFGTCNATVDVAKVSCACVTPNAGADFTMCLPKTSANLIDAPSGYTWVLGTGNPAVASINATTGVITGMTTAGIYKFVLQKIGDATCFDEMQITVSSGDAPIILCNDGSTSYTLVAQSGLINIVWYNMAGVQVGTGENLIVTSNTTGLSDGTEAFYYRGTSTTGVTSGCDVELCCPVKFLTQNCCPVPNCVNITVIKN